MDGTICVAARTKRRGFLGNLVEFTKSAGQAVAAADEPGGGDGFPSMAW
jgi:hypothetical protein